MSHAKPRHHRPSLNDSLESINREGLPGKVKNHLCRKVQDSVIASVQHVIEAALEEELSASLGWERYEHKPWGILQSRPEVEAISVPRSRSTVPLLTCTCLTPR
jgi:hypothetical protein